MEDLFELDVQELTVPEQENTEAAASSSWPYSCTSTRNSRCCI